MARQGKRHRIAPGIYADRTGYEVHVNGGRGVGNSKRFKATDDPEADLLAMRRWQLRRQTDLVDLAARTPKAPSGATLKTDVPLYLATLTGRKRRDAETLLDHWLKTPLAELPRHEIAPLHLRTQIAAWQSAGIAASTINHRMTALRALYRVLDEADVNAVNPTLKIEKLKEPDPQPREIPRDFIAAIFDAMPDRGQGKRGEDRPDVSLTKLRQMVKATTGLPDTQIMQLQRTHVDWRRRAVWVTPRRKGRGTKGKWLPLLPAAVRALRAFFDGKADGPYSTSAAAKSWARAVTTAKAAWRKSGRSLPALPDNLRPYDLRHSFLTEVFRRSKNVRAVQELGLHADPRMSERYMVGAVPETTKTAVQQVAAAARLARKSGTAKKKRKSA